MSVAEDIVFEERERADNTKADSEKVEIPEIDLQAFLSKLTVSTEIVLVLQVRNECDVAHTILRIEGHPNRILEMCGNYIGGYFVDNVGLVWGVFGTQDFVVKAVKEEVK